MPTTPHVRRLTCCLLLLATFARAEDTPPAAQVSVEDESLLRVGARVKLSVPTDDTQRTLTGRVLGLDDRSLWLQVREGQDPVALQRADIGWLQVSLGRRPATKEGALLGAAAFLGWGTFSGLVLHDPTMLTAYAGYSGLVVCGVGCAFAAAIVAVGGLGALLGALIGRAFTTEVWRTPKPRRFGAHVAPMPGGASAALSFRF